MSKTPIFHLLKGVGFLALNARQIRFCYLYAKIGNATEAYRRAGFQANNASGNAEKLLKKEEIQDEVARNLDTIVEATSVTDEWLIAEIAKIAKVDAEKVFDENGCLRDDRPKDTGAAIQSIEVRPGMFGVERKIKLYDKQKALEMLARHKKLFSDAAIDVDAKVEIAYVPKSQRKESDT